MKAIAFVVAAALVCAAVYADCPVSGECGDTITFVYASGVLKISGRGDGMMPDLSSPYSYDWNGCSENVTELVVENTVHSIGDYAFQGFDQMTKATLSTATLKIGDSSFQSTSKLTTITIAGEVESIGKNSFQNSAVVDVRFTCKNCTIGYQAFNNADSLQTLVIKGTVFSMSSQSVSSCDSLQRVVFPPITKPISGVFSGNSALSLAFFTGDKDICEPDKITGFFSSCSKLNEVVVPTTYNSTEFCGLYPKKVSTTTSSASSVVVSALVFISMLLAMLIA